MAPHTCLWILSVSIRLTGCCVKLQGNYSAAVFLLCLMQSLLCTVLVCFPRNCGHHVTTYTQDELECTSVHWCWAFLASGPLFARTKAHICSNCEAAVGFFYTVSILCCKSDLEELLVCNRNNHGGTRKKCGQHIAAHNRGPISFSGGMPFARQWVQGETVGRGLGCIKIQPPS